MEFLERLLQQDLADLVVGDHVGQREAFRRAVLDVAHVEIEPAAVEKKTAVAGRLVVIAVVQIDQPELFLLEDIIAHPRRHGGQPERFGSHTAIFGFQDRRAASCFKRTGVFAAAKRCCAWQYFTWIRIYCPPQDFYCRPQDNFFAWSLTR